MQPDESKRTAPGASDSIDLVTQTRSLRRKVIFWRRTAWLLFGGLGILAIIFWQRGEQHRRECRQSLAHYYRESQKLKLRTQPVELLEGEWRSMKCPPEMLSPYHYNLISRNWRTEPAEGEKIPLAVCRESHSLVFIQGRHVLFDDGHIEWRSESHMGDIVRAAERDDGK
jgi:hypothetical protein